MSSLFGSLPMPGRSVPAPEGGRRDAATSRAHGSGLGEAALPAIVPAGDDGWFDALAAGQPPQDPQDWEAAPGPDPQDTAPADLHAALPTWEERQAELADLVRRTQARAAADRAHGPGERPGQASDGVVTGAGAPWARAAGREAGQASGSAPDLAALTDGLNPAQEQAVTHAGSPLLIIAGAGSGKTRVLTHRIAYLLATGRALPGEVLAITFTNKAAAEMRERVAALVGPAGERMWVSTFHSACVRILRREHAAAGLRSTFSIYDSTDSLRLVTLVTKELGIDAKRFTPKSFAHRISDLKNELVTPAAFAERAVTSNPFERHCVEVYRGYQERLAAANALDFDDLIMRTVQLLQTRPAVAETYRRRFRHILVDEYQDTNHAQYVLVRELVGGPGTSGAGSPVPPAELTVVGDSDQSIYAFRGATIRNIEEFEKDYPSARTILLEQNYRSTQNILDAANAVIARNTGRRKKNLFTDAGAGAPVVGYVADSEHDEARWISTEIDRLADTEGVRPRDVAVFYRTNAQSRALEEAFMRAGQPYKVVGGTRFYERREVKDAIAYLRAVDNPDDDVSVRRILNVPKRGLGDKAEAALAQHAARYGVSFGQAVADAAGAPRPAPADAAGAALGGAAQAGADADQVAAGSQLPADPAAEVSAEPPAVEGLTTRARTQVARFHQLLESLRHQLADGDGVADVLDSALDASGYLAELRASDDPQDATRVENLAELHSVAADFQAANPQGTLADFLERVSLVADSDQLPAAADLDGAAGDEGTSQARDDGQITLMTVHIAKGLEFPVVFVTGMEDGTFPHSRSLADDAELAEERRLAYVALTRARQRLYVTRAAVRSAWGSAQAMPASRFLDDIPSEVIEWKRLASSTQALRDGGTGWGLTWGEGGLGYGARRHGGHAVGGYADRGGYGGYGRYRDAETASGTESWEDDDFAPAVGGGRGPAGGSAARTAGSGRLGRVETAKDRAQVRQARRQAGRGRPVRLHGSAPTATGGGTAADEGLPPAVQGLRVGDQVRHTTYGVGDITALEGTGRSQVAHVAFMIDGRRVTKRLMLRLAPLEKVEGA